MALFAQARGIAEAAHGCEVSGLRRHAGSDEVAFGLVAMEGHLLVEVAAEAIAAEEESELSEEMGDRVHRDLGASSLSGSVGKSALRPLSAATASGLLA